MSYSIWIIIFVGLPLVTNIQAYVCQPVWTRTNNTYAGGGTLLEEVDSLEACLAACVENDDCVGVDVNTNEDRDSSLCWVHENDDDYNNMNIYYNVYLYRLVNRCEECVPEWATTGGVRAFNAVSRPEFTTEAACLTACVADKTCVGVDVDRRGQTTSRCWFHFNSADFIDTDVLEGVTLYQLLDRCPTQTTQASTTQTPSANVSAASEHAGCFSQVGTEVGSWNETDARNLCRDTCRTNLVTFYGLQKQDSDTVKCYCLDFVNSFRNRLNSCDQTCAGSPCGGTSVVDYYTACPVGYYGQDCSSRCLCTADSWVCDISSSSCIPCESGMQGNRLCDVDECHVSSPCGEASCTNIPGSYRCSCYSGYELVTSPQPTCTDEDECRRIPYPCGSNEFCMNTEGSYTCQLCPAGYQPSGDNIQCEDVDECADETYDCEQLCENTEGGYTCKCNAGYTSDGKFCIEGKDGPGILPIVVPVVVVVVVLIIAVSLTVYFLRRRRAPAHTSPTAAHTSPTAAQRADSTSLDHLATTRDTSTEYVNQGVTSIPGNLEYEDISDMPKSPTTHDKMYHKIDTSQISEPPPAIYERV